MKKILLLSAIYPAVLLGACYSSKKATVTSVKEEKATTITDNRWILIELEGKNVAATINGKEPYLIFHTTDNRYSGNVGCNGIGGTFALQDNNRVELTPGPSTLMACEHMEVEQGLSGVLQRANHYNISKNVLTLSKDNGTALARFQMQDNKTAQQALNGSWELTYISGPKITFEGLYPKRKPNITFNLPEETAHGNSSCNNYNVGFSVEGSSIEFGSAMSTKMACQGSGEATFLSTLKTITHYKVNGTTLELIHNEEPLMRFEKKK